MPIITYRHCVPGSAIYVSTKLDEGTAQICNAHYFGTNGLLIVDDELQPELAAELAKIAKIPGSGVSVADSEDANAASVMEQAAGDVQEAALTAAQRLAQVTQQ